MDIITDTNIWLDFRVIQGLALPFRLQHSFYLSTDAVNDELLVPAGIGKLLVGLGLTPLEASLDEYFAVTAIMAAHPRLSRYDALTLSVTKERGVIMLTGDKALRKAGEEAGVIVKGTLWVFDELKRERLIADDEFRHYMGALNEHNGRSIRLPASEIRKRLE